MLACIIGNVYSGLMILALQSKLNHSDNERVAGVWIVWNKTYRQLQQNAAKALGSAARLKNFHTKLRAKYPEAFMLHPLKIYSKHNKPKMTKVFFPLLKVFNRLAFTRFDNEVLSNRHFRTKLKLYLRLRKNFFALKQVMRDKHIEDSQKLTLHNMSYQQALGYNDISVRMHKVFNSVSLRLYSNLTKKSHCQVDKAKIAWKLSEVLLRQRRCRSFNFKEEVAAMLDNMHHAAKVWADKHASGVNIDESPIPLRLISMADKLKIRRELNKQKLGQMQADKIRQLAQQSDAKSEKQLRSLIVQTPQKSIGFIGKKLSGNLRDSSRENSPGLETFKKYGFKSILQSTEQDKPGVLDTTTDMDNSGWVYQGRSDVKEDSPNFGESRKTPRHSRKTPAFDFTSAVMQDPDIIEETQLKPPKPRYSHFTMTSISSNTGFLDARQQNYSEFSEMLLDDHVSAPKAPEYSGIIRRNYDNLIDNEEDNSPSILFNSKLNISNAHPELYFHPLSSAFQSPSKPIVNPPEATLPKQPPKRPQHSLTRKGRKVIATEKSHNESKLAEIKQCISNKLDLLRMRLQI